MASTVYRTPIVLSADGKNHVPAQSGEKLDPNSIPIDSSLGNLLKPGENGLTLSPDDLISKEPNNSLVVSSSDGKLKVDANKLVAPNDPLLSVADNKIKSTLTVELTNAGQLILKGVGGKTVGSVTLPVVPGLPTVAEFLTNYTPQNSAGVIGGGGNGNYLHLQFAMSNGTTKDLYINYTAMLSGGGNSSTTNPSDLIVPGGGLVVDGNKLKVNCADLKTCINTTVSGNFLSNGGLTTDANGKFKVDWTKAPSDSSGGGSGSENSHAFSGTKIGEFDATGNMGLSGDYGGQGSSEGATWELTDVDGSKLLYIFLEKEQIGTITEDNSGGESNFHQLQAGMQMYCGLKNPFETLESFVAGNNANTLVSPSNDKFRYEYLGLRTLSDLSGGTQSYVNIDHYPTSVVWRPDKSYSSLSIQVICNGKFCKFVAYQ